MSQTYFAILTAVGEAKLANATALGTTVQITQMAVGDGNGATPIPVRTQTALVHEVRRAPLNRLSIDPANASQIIAEQVIPETIGGWWIRETGLFDAAGDLVAIANCAPTYKPQLAEGSGRTQVIRMVLIVSATASVELKIDPSVVLATRGYVDAQDAAHAAAADPHPQYAPKESPTFTGAPKAPTPAAGDNSVRLATTAYVMAAIASLVNGSPGALDTLKELADALGDDANFAATMTNALALKAPLASPALTGTPTAPTPALFDKSLKLATMAALQRALGNFHDTTVIQAATALTADDTGKVLSVNIGGFAITLPDGATLTNGACVLILATAACTVQRAGANVIYTGAGSSTVTSLALGIGDSVFLVWNGGSWVLQGGSAQLQFAGVFGASLAASGFQKLPSGLLVQWGAVPAIAANSSVIVSLPIAFPTNVMSVSLGSGSTGAGSPGINWQSVSNSQVKFWNQSTTVNSQAGTYLAIGY